MATRKSKKKVTEEPVKGKSLVNATVDKTLRSDLELISIIENRNYSNLVETFLYTARNVFMAKFSDDPERQDKIERAKQQLSEKGITYIGTL